MDHLAECKLKMEGTMKSIFRTISALLLPLLFWTGCGKESLPSAGGIPDHCIEITLSGLNPVLATKASSRGADAYNENLVKSVDCFFYPNGATNSDAVFMALGRGAEAVAEGDSTIYKVKVFFTDADANRMFGSTVSGTCQLYVICNAPLSYSGHTDVASLKELVVENDFTAQTVQSSFVMSADEIAPVTLKTEGDDRTASGRIKVSRAAAKIQFFLLIPSEFVDEAGQTWEPVRDAGISISMSNAVKRGKVDGEYNVQVADYISYGPRAITELDPSDLVTGHEVYTYSHVPFYSYPCAWSDLSDYGASVVFRIPWRIRGESNYRYRKYQLNPNVGTMDLRRNKYYRTFVKVASLGGADKESIVIIPDCDYEILPWMNEGAVAGQGLVPGELVTYKYLVFDHPEQVINNEPKVYFSYVTSSPIASVKINTIKYYDNTRANPERTQDNISNSTVTANTPTAVTTNYGTITVDKSNPGYVTLYHSLDNMYSPLTIYATITNEDGCTQDVVVVQNPSISLIRNTKAGSVFVNGYFARVAGTPPGWANNYNRYTDEGSYFYHCSSFWEQVQSYYTRYYQISDKTQTKNGRTTGVYGTIIGQTTNLDDSIDKNFYTTYINVTSFNTSNDYYVANNTEIHYRIGDPRVPSSEHYNGENAWTNNGKFYDYLYYNGSNTTELFAAWESPESILIAPQNVEDQDIIAPRFLVSSALNANTGLTFEKAVKRGATYQEGGYPAGRWRLPTEAEIAFIVARQKEGVIPVLYATDSYYWSGSGRLVYIPNAANASITFSDTADNTTKSCRFVYDLWYWGDEPSTTSVYHPNGHLYNYDASGNATLIR